MGSQFFHINIWQIKTCNDKLTLFSKIYIIISYLSNLSYLYIHILFISRLYFISQIDISYTLNSKLMKNCNKITLVILLQLLFISFLFLFFSSLAFFSIIIDLLLNRFEFLNNNLKYSFCRNKRSCRILEYSLELNE